MTSGFRLVDGDEASGIPPAPARDWIWALCAMIVAQWLLRMVEWPVGMIAASSSGILGVAGSLDPWSIRTQTIGFLVFAFAAVAFAAVFYSKRRDGRGWSALGVTLRALPGALPWILVGLVAAAPLIWQVALLGTGWERAALEALIWLTPATIIQAGTEEILFRGLMLTCLVARYGALRGILISALVFGSWHLYAGQPPVDAVVDFLLTFVFGVAAAILVLHQGHIGGAIALHVVFNVSSDIAAGLEHCCGFLQFEMSEFWETYYAASHEYWTLEALVDRDEVLPPLFTMVAETAIVFAACRSTVMRILGARDD